MSQTYIPEEYVSKKEQTPGNTYKHSGSYSGQVISVLVIITMAVAFNLLGILSSRWFWGFSIRPLISFVCIAVGAFFYLLTLPSDNQDKGLVGNGFFMNLIVPIGVAYIFRHNWVTGFYGTRDNYFILISILGIYNLAKTSRKYVVSEYGDPFDLFMAKNPKLKDLSDDLLLWIKETHIYDKDHQEEALQAFFARKELQKAFDDDLVSDESLKLWKSLDEQYTYYDGLQEKLESNFKKEFSELPVGTDFLLERPDGSRETYFKSFESLPISQLFTKTPPATQAGWDDMKSLFAYGDLRRHMNPINNTLTFWYEQLHHNLYPANRFFENLLVHKFVENIYIGIDRGVRGEQRLLEELDLFDERFRILENVNIREDGVSAESDALVISQFGVFTIEAKNFAEEGQYSVHVSKDGRWLRKGSNGRITPMNDVIRQSNRHILVKQKLVNREMKKLGLIKPHDFIDIHGVITVTNDVVDIDNESDYPIIRLSSLYDFIRNNTPKYSQEQVDAMVKLFKENQQPDVKFPIRDVEKEFDIQMAHLKERLKEYELFREHLKLD